jgi:DNA polymerase elongation subunit (family B)
METRYKGNEEQSGFTKGRSTVEHIYVIRQILEKCNMQQEDISLTFYDLEKAYVSATKKLLWQAFRKANVNQLYKVLYIHITITNAE